MFFLRGRIQKEYVRCVFLSGVKIVRVERKRNALRLSPMKCSLSLLISFKKGEFRAKKERKKFFKKKKISLLLCDTNARITPSVVVFYTVSSQFVCYQTSSVSRTFRVFCRSLFRRCDDDERKQRRSTQREE